MTIIVAAGVLNTALMSVFERTREIGTLRAVGARRSRVLPAVPARGRCCWGCSAPLGGGLLGAGLVAFFGRVRHPRLQRGPALLLRRRLPVPARRLDRRASPCPRVMMVVCVARGPGPGDHGRAHAPGRRAAVRVSGRIDPCAPRHRVPQPAARPAAQRCSRAAPWSWAAPRWCWAAASPTGSRGSSRASLVAVQTGHLQVVVRAAGLRAAEQPVRRLRPGAPPGRRGRWRAASRARARAAGVVTAVPYLYGARHRHRRQPLVAWRCVIGIDAVARAGAARGAPGRAAGGFLPDGDALAAYVAEPMARKLRLARRATAVSFVVQTPAGRRSTPPTPSCAASSARARPGTTTRSTCRWPRRRRCFDWPGDATNVKVMLRGRRAARRSPRAAAAVERIAGGHAPPAAEGTRVRVETFDEAGRFSFSIIQANAVRAAGALVVPVPRRRRWASSTRC